jgi:hypothetical protein
MNKLTRPFSLLAAMVLAVCFSSCDQASESGAPSSGDNSGGGQGGSMARFTISGDNLYAVTKNDLIILDAKDAAHPFEIGALSIGWGIETIYPYKDNLFIGSEDGMFIYDNSNPNRPKLKGQFNHARACDPVVVQDTLAFVTLRGGTRCGGFQNQLDVINISDLMHPKLIRSYPMTSPYGLGIDGNKLFICDGDDGLKVYDKEDPADLMRTAHYRDLNAYDVIPRNGVLMMIGTDGLYQYDYTVQGRPQLLSKIDVKRISKR